MILGTYYSTAILVLVGAFVMLILGLKDVGKDEEKKDK